MSIRFLIITFEIKSGLEDEKVQEKLNLARDWCMYMPHCYIVQTKNSADTWYKRLKPLLGSGDHLFICGLDLSERQGWLTKSVWNWIHQFDAEHAETNQTESNFE